MLTLSRISTLKPAGLDSDTGVEGILRTIGPDRIGFIVEPSGVTAVRPEAAYR